MGDVTEPDDTITFVFRKTYLYAVLGLIMGFGGGFGVAKVFFDSEQGPIVLQATTPPQVQASRTATSPTAPSPPVKVQIPVGGRPYSGPEAAPVEIVEFTDYQCPFCGRHFRQTLPQILSEYDGEIRYVVLNYPISTIHPFAQKASEAAECAHDQGRFWEYHDLLFQNQQSLDTDSLKGHAASLGLDAAAFDTCLDSGEKEQQVFQDFQLGQDYGVTGTPTFFVNGRRIRGAQAFTAFKSLIDAALVR